MGTRFFNKNGQPQNRSARLERAGPLAECSRRRQQSKLRLFTSRYDEKRTTLHPISIASYICDRANRTIGSALCRRSIRTSRNTMGSYGCLQAAHVQKRILLRLVSVLSRDKTDENISRHELTRDTGVSRDYICATDKTSPRSSRIRLSRGTV